MPPKNPIHPQPHSPLDGWNNEGGQIPPETLSAGPSQSDLEKLGITPVPLTVFDCGGYRYTNLRDAIAASKRNAKT